MMDTSMRKGRSVARKAEKVWKEARDRMEHTIRTNKAPCFGGRAPLFSQRDLLRLVGPLLWSSCWP